MIPTEKVMQKPLIAVLLASAFFSLNTQAADLVQVYQQALANDATYASARASAAAGRERIPQGRAGLLPTVGITGNLTRNNTDYSPFNEGQASATRTAPSSAPRSRAARA
jgi:outer membrane protein